MEKINNMFFHFNLQMAIVKHVITPKKKTKFSRKYEDPVSDFFIFTKMHTHFYDAK